MSRSRGFCFTDFEQNDYNEIFSEAEYLVVGEEICPTTNKKHMQGFVYFKNARSFESMKKKLPKAHFEVMKGTPDQAATYCKKENNYTETGTCPHQGKRSDIDEIRAVVKETNSMKKVVEVASSYQAVKMAEQILKYCEQPRTWKPYVQWFHGPTGTGKSKAAYEILGDECYTCLSTGRWFDGYDAHSNVLIDDMRKDFMKFHELLRLLDRYAMRIETKGGTRQFLAKHIIITSAFSPQELYETREDIKQLLRRIDEIKIFE